MMGFQRIFLFCFSYPKTSVVSSRILTSLQLQRKQSNKDCWDFSVTIPITCQCMPNLAWFDVLRDVRVPFPVYRCRDTVILFCHASVMQECCDRAWQTLVCVNIDLLVVINLKGIDLETVISGSSYIIFKSMWVFLTLLYMTKCQNSIIVKHDICATFVTLLRMVSELMNRLEKNITSPRLP